MKFEIPGELFRPKSIAIPPNPIPGLAKRQAETLDDLRDTITEAIAAADRASVQIKRLTIIATLLTAVQTIVAIGPFIDRAIELFSPVARLTSINPVTPNGEKHPDVRSEQQDLKK